MSDWNRSSRAIPYASIAPEYSQAIQKHVERYNLGPILTDVLDCIETRSDSKKKMLGGSKSVNTCAILTGRWLVLVIQENANTISVMSARCEDIVVSDYSTGPMAKLMPDHGVEIIGEFTGFTRNSPSEQRASLFVGLGSEPAAETFKQDLIHAVQDSKK